MVDRGQRGAAAVEMAIAAMFLVVLTCGVVDLGRGVFTSIGLRDAAQEGAIYGSFEPTDRTEVIDRVVQSVEYPELTADDVSITCTEDSRIVVEVQHEMDLVTPVISQMMGSTIEFERSFTGEAFAELCDGG